MSVHRASAVRRGQASARWTLRSAEGMIRLLAAGHETVARTAREVFRAAEAACDQPTCDLLTRRMQVHEKTAWMSPRARPG